MSSCRAMNAKGKSAPRKPSAAQLRVIDNLIADGSLGSIFPWPTRTLAACLAAGWIECSHTPDGYSATPAGREAARHGAR